MHWNLAGGAGAWTLSSGQALRSSDTDDLADVIGIRLENMQLVEGGEGDNVLRGVVKDAIFLGPYTTYVIDIEGDTIAVNSVSADLEVGAAAAVKVSPDDVRCLRGWLAHLSH